MINNRILSLAVLFSLHLLLPASAGAYTLTPQTLTVNGHTIQLRVPNGLRVQYLAGMDAPRFLTLGPDQELIVGSRGDALYRLKKPYRTPETLVRLAGRNHSVAYRTGQLFVAESGGLHGAPYGGSATVLNAGDFSLVVALPAQTGGHWSRTVVMGPDARLYIGIGISGNCSDEYLDASYLFERRRGGVFVVDETGALPRLRPFSAGLRNPIGLAFHPQTQTLYATNAGPDNLGYDQPPEVFSALTQGSFHGMPWFQYYNGAFRSGECATSPAPRPASEATPPSATFAARSTPEGIAFVTTSRLSGEFQGNALVAIHGSWAVAPGAGQESRRPPKISMVRFSNGNPAGVQD
ncbi:MAG: PQQ-dependent sugar dehydrogenase, partial [Desulfobacterales bacterium]